MVVARTYSAPLPLMRGRMSLIQNIFDDESNEFVKPETTNDSKGKVSRTRSYNITNRCQLNAGGGAVVNRKPAIPMIQRKGRFQKKNLDLEESTVSEQTQHKDISSSSEKRRKTRIQSGAAVRNIKSRKEFQIFASRQPSFPVHIRDPSSLRMHRLKKQQEQ